MSGLTTGGTSSCNGLTRSLLLAAHLAGAYSSIGGYSVQMMTQGRPSTIPAEEISQPLNLPLLRRLTVYSSLSPSVYAAICF